MPTSPSFSVRPRPNYRRRRTIALLVLLGIAVIVVALLSRSGGDKGEPPTAELAFTTKVSHLSQAKPADSGSQAAEGQAIQDMLTEYYQTAFVDPEKWGDGTFEDLQELFAEDARASFTKNVAALTIGEGRLELKRVQPSTSDLAITIYYDIRSRPTFAVARATFVGRGTLKETGPTVTIKQIATFYLQKSGDAWKITAYDADETQNTPTPSPTPSAT